MKEAWDEIEVYGIADLNEFWYYIGIRDKVARVYLKEEKYTSENLLLRKDLASLQGPDSLTDVEYMQLRKKTKLFFIRDKYLYKKEKYVPQ